MPSKHGVFRRVVDYFAANQDRLVTIVVLALIIGGLVSCFGSSCHVTITISSKAAEVSHGK